MQLAQIGWQAFVTTVRSDMSYENLWSTCKTYAHINAALRSFHPKGLVFYPDPGGHNQQLQSGVQARSMFKCMMGEFAA